MESQLKISRPSRMKLIATFGLLMLSGTALAVAPATEARIGEVVLSVPPQFKGPETASLGGRTSTVAYAISGVPGTPGGVLQITRMEGDTPPSNMSETEVARLTSQYLLRMLAGIERARTRFTRSTPQTMRLGGMVATKITWAGHLGDLPTNGAMYCVLAGPDLIWLHAFGPGNKPDEHTIQAIAAIETLSMAPSEKPSAPAP